MNYLELSKKNFPLFLAIFWLFIILFVNNLAFLSEASAKVSLILVFFVLVESYFSFWQLLMLAIVSGIYLDWFYLAWPIFLVKFVILTLLIVFFREKVFAKNNIVSLVLFFVLGSFIFEFSGNWLFFKSALFFKELIFGVVLLIITSLFKEIIS